MKYKVQGRMGAGCSWWFNDVPRTCGPDFETEDLEEAIEFAKQFLVTRPEHHRRVVDEQMNVVWLHEPD